MDSVMPITTITQGHVIALYAFDVGYAIDLARVRELLTTTPVQPLSRKKQTPTYLQYNQPPQLLSLGATPELVRHSGKLAHAPLSGVIEAKIFDFGCVSIAYRWPIASAGEPLMLQQLPQLAADLAERQLEAHARELIESLRQRMQPVITQPALAPLVEDYYLFVLEQFAQPLAATELLARGRAWLAQTLRFETKALSPALQDEALSHHLSYYEDDLVLLDWNAALIYDTDYEDTVNVLELLNVELLEARYVDAQLDQKLGKYAQLIRDARRTTRFPLRNPYEQAIQELTELRLDAALLTERVENSLKLIGNLYLARLHALAAQRFYLQEWQGQIKQKLELAAEFYQVLIDRLHTAQSHALEWIVIILILVEVILGLVRH